MSQDTVLHLIDIGIGAATSIIMLVSTIIGLIFLIRTYREVRDFRREYGEDEEPKE